MYDFSIADLNSDKDLLTDRVFDLGNNKLHVKREDPYGFWSMSLERGALPEGMRGHYTSFEEARKDVELYLESRKKEVKLTQ